MNLLPQGSIGKRIKIMRTIFRMTQKDVAREIGVSTPTIANWEGDTKIPTITNLVKLEKLLAIRVLSKEFVFDQVSNG